MGWAYHVIQPPSLRNWFAYLRSDVCVTMMNQQMKEKTFKKHYSYEEQSMLTKRNTALVNSWMPDMRLKVGDPAALFITPRLACVHSQYWETVAHIHMSNRHYLVAVLGHQPPQILAEDMVDVCGHFLA